MSELAQNLAQRWPFRRAISHIEIALVLLSFGFSTSRSLGLKHSKGWPAGQRSVLLLGPLLIVYFEFASQSDWLVAREWFDFQIGVGQKTGIFVGSGIGAQQQTGGLTAFRRVGE
jgi:hypothetical protein